MSIPEPPSTPDNPAVNPIQSEIVRAEPRGSVGDLLYPALLTKLQSGDAGAIEQIIAYQRDRIAEEQKWKENEQRLREKEVDQKHALALQTLALEERKEENRQSDQREARQGNQKGIVWAIAAFSTVFVASLGFSFAIKDKEARVPISLLTTGAALLGGTALKGATQAGKSSASDKTNP